MDDKGKFYQIQLAYLQLIQNKIYNINLSFITADRWISKTQENCQKQ